LFHHCVHQTAVYIGLYKHQQTPNTVQSTLLFVWY